MPSPRGVRVASDAVLISIVRGTEVAVPARGAGCIAMAMLKYPNMLMSCRPREGCGLHRKADRPLRTLRRGVAVPARGCGLHRTTMIYNAADKKLPSPRGARVASQSKRGTGGLTMAEVAVPARGAGCIYTKRQNVAILAGLPSPRGVRIASSLMGIIVNLTELPSP